MHKLMQRTLALILVILMVVGSIPFASAAVINTNDYELMFSKAYIINPSWGTLSGELSFDFQGETYTETYNASRHFKTFAAAYKVAAAEEMPVLIFCAGNYASTITLKGSAVILGPNAGVSPNAAIDLDTANPKSGWAAATRYAEANFKMNFALQANGTVVIDGINYVATTNLLRITANSEAADITVKNSIINIKSTTAYVFNDASSPSINNKYTMQNIRMDGSSQRAFITAHANNLTVDGLYLANSAGAVLYNSGFASTEFHCEIKNSYFYKNTYYTLINPSFANDMKDMFFSFHHNMWYESGSSTWGFMCPHSSGYKPHISYVYEIHHNTFLADGSVNDIVQNTFINGNSSTASGPLILRVNFNRIIGYGSMFPNFVSFPRTNSEGMQECDFNYNYFAPTYSGYSDQLGTTSRYYTAEEITDAEYEDFIYYDPLDTENLIYFTDYAMEKVFDLFYITETNFNDKVNLLSIDNANAKIYMELSSSFVSNPEIYFRDEDITAKFYTNSACTTETTVINGTGSDYVMYAKATLGSQSQIFTVYVYTGASSIPAFSSSFTDAAGILTSSAYLLAPEVASLSSGSTYVTSINGKQYSFTVGTNAFATLAQIHSKAGSATPTVILPYGEYGEISITKNVNLYGENYETSAMGNAAVDAGLTWGSGMHSNITNLNISSASTVKLSGITVTGTLTDNRTSGTLNLNNVRFNSTAENAIKFSGGSLTVNFSGVGVAGVGTAVIGGTLPTTLTIQNFYNGSDKPLSNATSSGTNTVTVTNSVFSNITANAITDIDAETFTVKNSEFYSNGMTDALISLKPNNYTTLSITNNLFVNKGAASAPVYCPDYQNNSDNAGNHFTGNKVLGFGGFTAKNSDFLLNPTDVTGNFFADFDFDYATLTGAIPQGFADCDYYYTDYALTTKVYPKVGDYNIVKAIIKSEANRQLGLEVASNVTTLDLTKYITKGSDTLTVLKDGIQVDPSSISLDYITRLTIYIGSADNMYVSDKWTMTIEKEIPEGLNITGAVSGAGKAFIDNNTVTVSIPANAESVAVDVLTDGGTAVIYKDGVAVSTISGVGKGERVEYVVKVTQGTDVASYPLVALRSTNDSLALDYASYPTTAYIITSTASSSTVSFYYRGKTYSQAYDADRHFTTFDAAYAHYEANSKNLTNDTPVFILDKGSYSTMSVKYRAIILGADAGIEPTTNGSLTSDWSSNNTTVTGAINRTTRVDGTNSNVSVEYAMQQIEANDFKGVEFFLLVDGIQMNGTAHVNTQDIDVGTYTYGSETVTVTGSRINEVYMQNVYSNAQTSHIYSGQDTTFNFNTVKVTNSRFQNLNATSLFRKYIDDLTFRGNYLTGCTASVGLLAAGDDMSVRNNINYTFDNNDFVTNKFTRVLRFNATAHTAGYYKKGAINFTNNYVYESGAAEWGLLSFAGNVPNLTFTVTGNDFIQTSSSSVKIKTAVEGNAGFYANPYTLKVNNNRFVGMTAVLPNLAGVPDETLSQLSFDFNANYYASSASASNGSRLAYYSGPTGSVDPILSDSFTYYYDYDMTKLVNGTFASNYNGAEILNTALMLDPTASTLATGTHTVRYWDTEYYEFVAGTTIFATMADLQAVAGDNITQVIIPATTVGELSVPKNYSVFGINFNVNPNAVTSTLGDDWAKNTKWGANGETVVSDIVIPASATGTDTVVKGLTLRGRLYDVDRPVSSTATYLTFENIVIEHTSVLGAVTHGATGKATYTVNMENSNNTTGSNNNDTVLFKNFRIEKIKTSATTGSGLNRFLNERVAADFTIDGLYCNMVSSGLERFGWWKLSANQPNGTITLTNSNIRGTTYSGNDILYFEGRNHVANASGQTAVLNITNNAFVDTVNNGANIVISVAAYSDVNITGNLFLNSTAYKTTAIKFEDLSANTTYDVTNVYDISKNRFVGTTGAVDYSTSNAGTLDLSYNYCADYTEGYASKTTGGVALTGTNTKCDYYYYDYALTTDSKPKGPTFDEATGVLTVRGTGTLWGPGLEAAKRPFVTEVIIEEGITAISANVFNGANFSSLKKVTLPEGIKSLGKGAFTDCKMLKEINLPSTLTSIGEMAFYNCKSLTTINIPTSVTSIGKDAYLGLVASDINYLGTRDQWDKVSVGEGNTRLSFVACTDDVRTILDKKTKGDAAWIFNEGRETVYFAGSNAGYIKSYTEASPMIPADIAAKVKYVDIDETMAGFGAYVFANMTNLVEVTGGENIRYVGNYSFKGCTSLKVAEFTNADYFGGISYGLFSDCTALEEITISDSIAFFYGASFQRCTSLKSINVPARAGAVGEYAFRGCTALQTVTIEEGVKSFGAGAIQGCSAIKNVYFPTTLNAIGTYAFYNVPATLRVNYAGTQTQWNNIYVKTGNGTLTYLPKSFNVAY